MANQTTPAIQIKDSNVGIGTTSPAYKLDVAGSLNVAANVYNYIGGNKAFGGNGSTFLYLYTGTTALSILNNADSSELVRITNAGNVGIGTTAPIGLLNISKDSTTDGSSQAITISSNSVPTKRMNLGYVPGSNYSFIDTINYGISNTNQALSLQPNGGNVGIGTTSPQSRLDLSPPSSQSTTSTLGYSANAQLNIRIPNSVGDVGQIVFTNDAAPTAGYASIGVVMTSSSGVGIGDIIMSTKSIGADAASTERMRITSAGNVGIGTTAPSAKFVVQGTAGNLYIDDLGSGFNYYDASNVHSFRNTAGTSRLYIDASGGNVGIGTTGPTEKLHVDGSTLITYNNSFQSTNSVGNKAILARVSPTSGIVNYAEYATATNLNGFVIGSDDARVKGNITGDSLEFITNTSTRMTILSGGNVGINTTTPGSTLHVVGDVLIQTGALGVGVNPNATDGRIDASNDIVAFSTSDRRLKENITPIANALEKVRSLTGVEFDWKEETKSVHGYEGHDVGVIAQDVQAVLPEAVRTNDSGYLSVRYEKMIALLVEAMKEQQAQIDELKAQINDSPR